ncbi:MAG: response regulator, partial [Deltaproteobacteria bacterium]|nr:response regulator [Deltaproteobacteria bacterium]
LRHLLVRELGDLDEPIAIHSVPDATAALALLGQEPIAVVITDIRMPGLDGVELTRRLKQADTEIEVILLTGHASIESASEALRLGAFDYLEKPLDDIGLINERVQAALERRRARARQHAQHRDLQADRRSLEQILDALPMAIFLLDGDGRIRQSNHCAQRILRERDALHLDDKRPKPLDAGARRTLDTLLANATRDDAPCGGTLSIPRVPTGAPISMLISPLVSADATDSDPAHARIAPGEEDRSAVVAMLIADPTQDHKTAEATIAGLYGLTPAEARLATELIQGKNLEVASHALGITPNTARTHLKRIFRKTRTSRQGELISVLLSSPAILSLG